jgi:acetoin utilization deacetylase AcuC-like enzyme
MIYHATVTVSIVRDARFRDHDTGYGHPERPERLRAIEELLDSPAASQLAFHKIAPRAATREELELNHTHEYLDRLDALRGKSARLDADTSASPRSVELAYEAAGASVDLFTAVAKKEAPPGIALVRPPGHHAEADHAMGFCLINNVAVGARSLIANGLAERIAIYDWDVHHGNGTQNSFFDDPNVLYLSTHQYPFYPGSGATRETGTGKGSGATVNVPLPAGTDDKTLLEANRELLLKKVRAFRPDMILISAGFDPYEKDPLGGFLITLDGFSELAARWRALADELCDGKIAAVLEGGYDLDGLAQCVLKLLERWDS